MFRSKETKIKDLEMFTVFDSKVGIYKEPVLAHNRHDIIRQIQNMFLDPKQNNNQLVTNSEDFQLFKIGEFSRQTGEIVSCHHEHIANFHDLKTAVMQSTNTEHLHPVGIGTT